jgi:hypothetical protein
MIIHSPIFSGSISQDPNNAYANLSGSFTGSFTGVGNFEGLEADSVAYENVIGKPTLVSGSSQVSYPDLSNIPSGIISSSAQIDALFNIDGLVSGAEQVTPLLPTGVVSGSSQVSYPSLSNIPAGIVSGSSQVTPLLPSGTVSGSSQVNANSITNFDSNVKEKLDADGVISGSSQVNANTITNFDSNVKDKLNTDGVISGSVQVDITSTTGTLDISTRTNLAVSDTATIDMVLSDDTLSANAIGGIVSGSSQITYSEISSIPAGIVSGSAQITPLLPTGVVSGSSQVIYTSLSSIPGGIVSGSSQVVLNDANKTGFDTTDVVEGTNLYYTDARVKTKLNAEAVVSGSSQILTLVSIDEDTMTSNSDTKLPTQQSVKAYVDSKVSALVDSAPGALDTLNELAAALGDDANFSTTISNQIAGKVSQSLEIISGNGLTGGGNLTTNRTLAVGAGDGISVAADSVAVDGTVLRTNGFGVISGSIQVDHDATTNFVANEHIDHTSVTLTAGNGLTGGGTIAASRTFNVVGTADRISVSADAVDIASTYVGQSSITTLGTIGTGTWQGSVIASAYLDADTAHLTTTQTFSGAKTFSAAVSVTNSTASTSKTTGALKVTGGVGIEGALNVGGDVVAYASSDERLKDNIELISNPIEKVQSLKGVTWSWNENADELQKSLPTVGVIAQDVEKVLPQLVHDRENGFKGVDYAKLTGLLIEAIKEQQKQIEELKSKLG